MNGIIAVQRRFYKTWFEMCIRDRNNPSPSGSGGRMVAAVVAFAINYACYFSEIYRGGIEAVPKGQTEACLLYTSRCV